MLAFSLPPLDCCHDAACITPAPFHFAADYAYAMMPTPLLIIYSAPMPPMPCYAAAAAACFAAITPPLHFAVDADMPRRAADACCALML